MKEVNIAGNSNKSIKISCLNLTCPKIEVGHVTWQYSIQYNSNKTKKLFRNCNKKTLWTPKAFKSLDLLDPSLVQQNNSVFTI